MKTKDFDKKFDKGKNISKHLAVSKTLRSNRKQKIGNIEHRRKVHPTQLEWFRSKAEAAGGGNYQTLLNNALREYITNQQEPFEKVIRRVVREELHAAR